MLYRYRNMPRPVWLLLIVSVAARSARDVACQIALSTLRSSSPGLRAPNRRELVPLTALRVRIGMGGFSIVFALLVVAGVLVNKE